ncbi:MAG: murein biosynthesis integral membrane protein MurJ, partial [Candidatus Methylomirabilia bacterium]
TFIGQLVSVAYEIAVAARFGTTWEGDALALAFIVPFALSYEITVWIGSAFLPVYLHVWTREGPGAASALFFRSAISLVAFAILLTGGWVVGAPWLVALLTGDSAAEAAAVTLRLFRLFGLLLLLVPCSAFLARTHEAHRSFVLPAGRQFCWYGAALVAVLLATQELGLSAVPLGMTLGLAIYLGVLLAGLRRRIDDPGGLRGTPGEGDRRLAKLLPPLMVGSLATWLNVMVERALAARQGVGSLAALTYAFRLLNFPLTLFLLNATAILFPTLALHAARLERGPLATLTARALRLTFFFVLPLAALAAALATPVVQVAFERGAFTRASTATTSLALALYAPGLAGLAGVQVLTRSYQALQLVPRMVTVAVIAAAANVAAMLVLTLQLGFVGIPLAWSLTSWLHLAGLLYGVRQELVGLDLGALFRSVLRCAVAAALAGGVAGVTVGLLGEGGPLSLLGGGLAGIAAYTLAVLGIAGEEARLALRTAVPSAFPSLPLRIEEP